MKINFMKKFFYLTILMFVFTGIKLSYADEFSDAIISAKNNLFKAANSYDRKELIKVRGQFERILQLKKEEWLVNYYIALAEYNIASTFMQSDDKSELKKYNQAALKTIDKVIEGNPNFSDAYVLQMALNFNRFIYEQDKMMDIVSASNQSEELAKASDPNNPRYFLIKGVSNFYTPAAFGGGYDKAIEFLQKSVDYFKVRKEKVEYYPDWGADLANGYMALSLIKRDKDGDLTKAKEFIDAAYGYNPESGFVKNIVQKEYDEKTSK
ncbi:MAG TPA: hypothetical protein DEP28_09485 [Bacteroidetes bacterium]|nr:hypothetical protein [Bacteroidota bacterium]